MPISPGLRSNIREGGIAQLVSVIERRSRQPGAELYLVTTEAGEPIVGNVAGLPEGVLSKPGLVVTDYLRAGETTAQHRAVARIFLCPAAFASWSATISRRACGCAASSSAR